MSSAAFDKIAAGLHDAIAIVQGERRPAGAIAATFADFKLVKTRGVAQLVMEVPLEQADAALALLGGVPLPSREAWVGIAPLQGQPQDRGSGGAGISPSSPEDGARPEVAPSTAGSRWRDLPPAQQAGILCNDPDYQRWIGAGSDTHAALLTRQRCGVASRADLNTNDLARRKWERLAADFFARHDHASQEAAYGR